MSQLVLVESLDPAISILTLNRPEKRNALSRALIEQVTAAVSGLAEDPLRRIIIFRAAGPAFCAGLDLTEAAGEQEREGPGGQALASMYQAICDSPLVTIAAAQGPAIGGGAGLALACDFVLAGEGFRLGFPEVHRGLVAALVTAILRRQVGDRAARELILLGQTIDAPRALSLGLINRIAPAARLLDDATVLARQLCLGAPNALVRSKRELDELAARPIREDLQLALRYHLLSRHGGEATEGMAAFAEKRLPRWGVRDVP